MATKEKVEHIIDPLTTQTPVKDEGPKYPTTVVTIPALPEAGNGVKVDQYEHVTIANEVREDCYKVLRGEPVEIPVPVYIQLKERYPKI